MEDSDQNVLRSIPSVESLLQDLSKESAEVPRDALLESVRCAVTQARESLLGANGATADADTIRQEILANARERIRLMLATHYRKAINATGIILHTGLGRAVLARKALRQIAEELSGYCVLQLGVETGKRSKRDERIEDLLVRLTGAEAATVVNNNAAATSIVLNTVAKGREVIVSRGQLVEIGGSFRLPDIMKSSGVKLVEVGTTNRTHLRDYGDAVTDNTAAVMRVHPSNYRIVGFTSEVPLADLVRLAHDHGLVMIDDVGAGSLIDFSRFGFQREPTLPESVRAGADIITSSADKLIGASQGGIIIGRKDLIAAVRKNPLARVVRVGKLTLAVLEATLSLFLEEAVAMRELPTLQMLNMSLSEIGDTAQRIAEAIGPCAAARVEVIDGSSRMGSGSLPGPNLPTRLVAIQPRGMDLDEMALCLRRHRPAIFTRIQHEQLLVDPRTLLPGEEEELIRAMLSVLGRGA